MTIINFRTIQNALYTINVHRARAYMDRTKNTHRWVSTVFLTVLQFHFSYKNFFQYPFFKKKLIRFFFDFFPKNFRYAFSQVRLFPNQPNFFSFEFCLNIFLKFLLFFIDIYRKRVGQLRRPMLYAPTTQIYRNQMESKWCRRWRWHNLQQLLIN